MEYKNYKYIYPPRPENTISPASLGTFSTGDYLGQPKLNGSSMMVYTDGRTLIVMNRHKKPLAHKINTNELLSLHRGTGWMVLCGEYMNKGQKDEEGKPWTNNFVIFDILVYNSDHMIGKTFEERFELLKELYPDNLAKKYIHQISLNCYRVDSIRTQFNEVYDNITQYQMYEGLVLKFAKGKLENGITVNNNTRTQIKCRKSTKNYAF